MFFCTFRVCPSNKKSKYNSDHNKCCFVKSVEKNTLISSNKLINILK